MPSRDDYEFLHTTAFATTVVVGVACKLINVNVNTTGAAFTVYNAATSLTCTTSNVVGIIKAAAPEGTYLAGGKKLSAGMVIVSAGGDFTVTYALA